MDDFEFSWEFITVKPDIIECPSCKKPLHILMDKSKLCLACGVPKL